MSFDTCRLVVQLAGGKGAVNPPGTCPETWIPGGEAKSPRETVVLRFSGASLAVLITKICVFLSMDHDLVVRASTIAECKH